MIPVLVRLTAKQKAGLEKLNEDTGASQAFLIRKALDEYLERKGVLPPKEVGFPKDQ